MVLEKNITIKQAVLEKLGEVYPVAQLGDMRLPFFDVDIVAGFPIPLDNDEKGQDIELLRMLCPNPEASYLIRVHMYRTAAFPARSRYSPSRFPSFP